MASSINNSSTIESRGVIVCNIDDGTEPKTILEIGGVSRPTPTYSSIQRASSCSPIVNHQPYSNNWLANRTEIVAPPFIAYPDFEEQRIIRVTNMNWNSSPERSLSEARASMTALESGKRKSNVRKFIAEVLRVCILNIKYDD